MKALISTLNVTPYISSQSFPLLMVNTVIITDNTMYFPLCLFDKQSFLKNIQIHPFCTIMDGMIEEGVHVLESAIRQTTK